MGLESFKDIEKLKKKREELNKRAFYDSVGKIEMSDTELLIRNELNEQKAISKDNRKTDKDYIDSYGDDRIYFDDSRKGGNLKQVIATENPDLQMIEATERVFKRLNEKYKNHIVKEIEEEKGRSK